ncbi:MAG TPA: hypothetical protein VF756_28870 [Thermoanaerobaculia bacterium]
MEIRRPLQAVAVCVFLLVLGCGGGDDGGSSPTEPLPTADSLVIIRAEPSEGTALRRGSVVSFRVRVRYEMAQTTTGSVAAFAFSSSPSGPGIILTNPLLPETRISGHRGEADVSFSLTVPQAATEITVDLGLFPGNSDSSNVGDEITYSTQ